MPLPDDPTTKFTMKQWGQLLAIDSMELTLEQAKLFAALRSSDYENENRAHLTNIANAVIRMELYLAKLFPDYNQTVQQEVSRIIAEETKRKSQQALNPLEDKAKELTNGTN